MKRFLLPALFFLLASSPAFAQVGGTICFFSDDKGEACNLSDLTPGFLSVYVIHRFAPGASSSQFSAPKPACMVGATWLKDEHPFPVTIGDSQTGVAIGYGTCIFGSKHILTIRYAVAGTTGMDCAYTALPAAGESQVNVTDCEFNLVDAGSGTTYINSGLACDCPGALPPAPPPLTVSPTTLDFGLDSLLTLQVSTDGNPTLPWRVFRNPVSWIKASPLFGAGDGPIMVWIDRRGLPAGTHSGVVNVVSVGGVADVPVTMEIDGPTPFLRLSTNDLDFAATLTSRSFSISNFGSGLLTWTITHNEPWLTATPSNGSGNASITLTVDRTGLPPGPYSDVVQVNSNGGIASVVIAMTVSSQAPNLSFSPAVLSFPGGTNSLPVDVTNTGGGELQWSVTSDRAWLTASPASGTNDGQVTASVDRTGLSDGTYSGTLTIASNGGGGTVAVTLTVANSPILAVNPTQLSFSPTNTQRTFNITNAGVGTLDWWLTPSAAWIEIVGSSSGSGDAMVTVRVDPDSVPAVQQQTGTILVNSNGGVANVDVQFTRPVAGTGGVIGLYSDPTGVDCNVDAKAIGLVSVYVVHQNTAGATAAQFAAPMPSCWTGGVYLSDTSNWPVTIGNSQTGVAVPYGSCIPSPNHILTINYFVTVPNGATCCQYPVLPDPAAPSGHIEVVDCSGSLVFGDGSACFINPNASCACLAAPTPVEDTTWGRVKAMYLGSEAGSNENR
ncbi:MAG: hypothetical protein ACE5EO_04500 [Candidatus Krumholzibacteriia bacterium]